MSFALSAQQRRIYTDDGPDSVEATIVIDGPLDRAALERALDEVVACHPALRTTFSRVAGLKLPVQVVHDALPPAWDDEPGAGPVRARLTRVDDERHVLSLVVSALCADRATLTILFAEIADAYDGMLGPPAEIDPLQVAAWQDTLVDSEDGATAFWREQAARAAGAAPLLLERARDGRRHELRRELTTAARARLGALAITCGVSIPALLLASFQRVLVRFSAGGAIATRLALDLRDADRELLGRVCGAIAQEVPFTCDVGDVGLRAHATRVDAALRTAAEHLPFYRPDREPSISCPALTISFTYDDASALGPRGRGAVCFRLVEHGGCQGADLSLVCRDTGDALAVLCTHDVGRFSPALAAAIVDGLVLALEHASPDARPGDAPLPGRGAASATTAATGVVHRLFAQQVVRTPERVAVICERDRVTFAELDRRACAIAAALAVRGVRRGDVVAICADRTSQAIAAILGVLHAGAAFAPLHLGYPAERLRAILDAARVRVVLADGAAPLDAFADRVVVRIDGELPAGDPFAVPVSPADLAYVIHTSGSTGVPKGVEVTHGSVVNLLHALRAHVGASPSRRVSLNAPLAFDSSVKQWIQLLDGHTVVMVPEQRRLDPVALAAFLAEHEVEMLDCTPSQLRLLLAEDTPLPRIILVGGEAIDPALWAAMTARPELAFHDLYGPTECTVDTTAARVAGDEPTIGAALAGCTAYVLDDQLRPLPVGAPGELYIGGAGVARGYRGRPDATAACFLPDPFTDVPGARMYRTGDLTCWREDGQLAFLGRRDGQVKLRGHRIELDEIAAHLRRLDDVRDAVVVLAGQGVDARLVAYVVPRAELRVERLREHVRRHLPEVMVPAAFVTLAALPLTANGKLALAALPPPDEPAGAAIPLDGRTAQAVAAIWREVLGVSRVGARDNFFDLGGHSLRMVQVHARLREVFGRDIPMVDLFRHPTIEALSQYLDRSPAQPPASTQPLCDRAEQRRAAVVSNAQRRGRRRT